jgi:hypothetical protein
MKIDIFYIWKKLISILAPIIQSDIKNKSQRNQNWKSFYIMKVIYINIIYRALSINVRNVQQSLYMGRHKYILKL